MIKKYYFIAHQVTFYYVKLYHLCEFKYYINTNTNIFVYAHIYIFTYITDTFPFSYHNSCIDILS